MAKTRYTLLELIDLYVLAIVIIPVVFWGTLLALGLTLNFTLTTIGRLIFG